MRFCLTHVRELGLAFYPFLVFSERWQRATSPTMPMRKEVLSAALWALEHLERWRSPKPQDAVAPRIPVQRCPRCRIFCSVDRGALRGCRSFACRRIPARTSRARIWRRARQHAEAPPGRQPRSYRRSSGIRASDLNGAGATALRSWTCRAFGLRPHIYFPASDIQGPFPALLQANEAAGLRLTRGLARHASERYARDITQRHRAHLRPLTFRYRGRETTIRGDERMYTWFRPSAHDSEVLTSALMALETSGPSTDQERTRRCRARGAPAFRTRSWPHSLASSWVSRTTVPSSFRS